MPRQSTPFGSGVYQIRNTINGKVYIGSAICFRRRWQAHVSALRKGVHHSRYLQNAWNKYGEDAFIFEVIVHCLPWACEQLEQERIDLHKSANSYYGYNISPTAGSCLGVKHSDKTRAKISAASKRSRPVIATSRIEFRISPAEKAILAKSAKARGYRLSEWILQQILADCPMS